jgi:hypothetical protein
VPALRKLILLLALCGPAVAAPAAFAQEYEPVAPAGVSDGAVVPGEPVTFSGRGFEGGETISIDVTYDGNAPAAYEGERSAGTVVLAGLPQEVVDTVQASEDGTFSTSVVLTRTGTAVLTATGLSSGVTATATVKVLAPGQDGGEDAGALPTTGSDDLPGHLITGMGAVLAGAALVAFAVWLRRRGAAGARPTDEA